ncbi:helix-turn-helix domain-containing protein [Anabaena sp. CCY 9402-a]|uniref:helix-turn-helix domain-containing protein n=1 Tax=Anabaena sp. CCY 9402-a TaxID=3103867 RepID=UPI0039C6983A
MKETKTLSALQEQAALMVANGKNHSEIAEELGRSPNWVARLAMSQEFKDKVSEFEQEIKSQLKSQLTLQISDGVGDVLAFRERLKTSADDIHRVGKLLLSKVTKAIEDLESEDIPVSRLGGMLRTATDAIDCSTTMTRYSLGIDELVDELVDVQKSAGSGKVTN